MHEWFFLKWKLHLTFPCPYLCLSFVSMSVILNYTLPQYCVTFGRFGPYLVRLYANIMANDIIMMFLPPVSVIKRVKFLPIHVRTRDDGRGYADTDRCSLPYESEWLASIHGHGYTDTDARTWTGVA